MRLSNVKTLELSFSTNEAHECWLNGPGWWRKLLVCVAGTLLVLNNCKGSLVSCRYSCFEFRQAAAVSSWIRKSALLMEHPLADVTFYLLTLYFLLVDVNLFSWMCSKKFTFKKNRCQRAMRSYLTHLFEVIDSYIVSYKLLWKFNLICKSFF